MRKIKYILLIMILLLIMPTVKASTLIKFGDNINLKKDITDSAILFGSNVDAGVNTTDSIYAMGNSVKVVGQSEYVYLMGSSVLLEGGVIKNAYIMAQSIESKAEINKDLFAMAGDLKVSGKINGDLYAKANSLVINTTITGNVYIEANNITLTKNAKIIGTLNYNADATLDKEGAQIGNIVLHNPTTHNTFDTLMFKVSSFLNILVVGLVSIYCFKKTFNRIDKIVEISPKDIALTIFNGLIGIIIIPFLVVLGVVFNIGIALGVIVLILYVIGIYISSIVAAWVIHSKLLHKKISKLDNRYITFTLALIIINLIQMIPYIGTIAMILVTLYGMGVIINLIKKRA